MSAQAAADGRIASLARLIVVFRLAALNVAIFELVTNPGRAPLASLGMVILALVLYGQLRLWSRNADAGRRLLQHPATLMADALLTMGLLAFFGPESPFFLSTIGLALAGGAVYGRRGALASSLLLMAAYYVVLFGRDGTFDLYFPTYVTLPLLYPTSAAGAAAVRRLLEEQAQTIDALRSAELAAVAGEERTRVAREMHDSLGKTLYGIALQASGLSRRVAVDAPQAAALAKTLSGAAQRAAGEAREIIADLRSDALELPLHEALRVHVERWTEESGIAATMSGDPVDLPHPGTRYELFSIVKEALRNVEAHAQASCVEVRLRQQGEEVLLSIGDDGVGIGASGTAAELEPEGHWGLIGMAERAQRVGATVRVDSPGGSGTCVEVRLPSGDVRTPEPWALEGRKGAVPA